MTVLLKFLAGIVNYLHDLIVILFKQLGFKLTDQDLHFWVIGIIGIVVFILSDIVFKNIAKWSISAISFVYTLTVLVVLVFAVEIEQRITGHGSMEFSDIVAGLWGFIVMFAIYVAIRGAIYAVQRQLKKRP